jgi:phosphoglycolate phosphatase-like HAD superfamily hydrolase
VLPPISLILATWARGYVDALTATRYLGPSSGEEARAGINLWVEKFASACTRSVEDAMSFEARVRQIDQEWRTTLGAVRRNSASDLLLRVLPGAPILTAIAAAELIGRSYPQVNQAIARLTDAGILSQVTVGKRNRAFEAKTVIDAFTDLERQLASPAGDTRVSSPARPVTPRRPRSY